MKAAAVCDIGRLRKTNQDCVFVSDTAVGPLPNLLLVIAAVESLPAELTALADEVTVYFPWGSLLEAIHRRRSG